MTSAVLVCFFMQLFLEGKGQNADQKPSFTLRQDQHFVSAQTGDTVTLRCFYEGDDSAWLYWYKQSLGDNLKLISTFYILNKKTTFQDEFKNSSRFTLDTKNRSHHLTIKNLQTSDSATYYCARSFSFVLIFAEGTTLTVKDSGLTVLPVIHQEIVKYGKSTTLGCTVHTGSCDKEHRVYWFKNSEKSHQEMIYTNGGTGDECQGEKNPCVYNLLMKNLTSSHAGTYYCAVASCGLVLFGNGTMLEIKDDKGDVLVNVLSSALAFTIALAVFLAYEASIKEETTSCISTGPGERSSAVSGANTEDVLNSKSLHLSPSRMIHVDPSERQRDNTWSECVYSGIRQRNHVPCY